MNIIRLLAGNDIVVRAVKTFVQAFVAAWMVSGFVLDKSAVIAAAAAGISAVWNYVRELLEV